MQQFFSLLSWRLFTAQHVSGVFPPIIGRSARPRTQHGCHRDTKVKPKAATAVIELLMMGGKTPETYWAVNKRQDNKLKNCCIWLVIYLNYTMMHGLTNLKFKLIMLFVCVYTYTYTYIIFPGEMTKRGRCYTFCISNLIIIGSHVTSILECVFETCAILGCNWRTLLQVSGITRVCKPWNKMCLLQNWCIWYKWGRENCHAVQNTCLYVSETRYVIIAFYYCLE
jgi:hypothetical protein